MLFYVLTGKRSRSLVMTEGPGTTAGLWESASGTAFFQPPHVKTTHSYLPNTRHHGEIFHWKLDEFPVEIPPNLYWILEEFPVEIGLISTGNLAGN